jgi:hypothetical protein
MGSLPCRQPPSFFASRGSRGTLSHDKHRSEAANVPGHQSLRKISYPTLVGVGNDGLFECHYLFGDIVE